MSNRTIRRAVKFGRRPASTPLSVEKQRLEQEQVSLRAQLEEALGGPILDRVELRRWNAFPRPLDCGDHYGREDPTAEANEAPILTGGLHRLLAQSPLGYSGRVHSIWAEGGLGRAPLSLRFLFGDTETKPERGQVLVRTAFIGKEWGLFSAASDGVSPARTSGFSPLLACPHYVGLEVVVCPDDLPVFIGIETQTLRDDIAATRVWWEEKKRIEDDHG